jgi:hypothetical protein
MSEQAAQGQIVTRLKSVLLCLIFAGEVNPGESARQALKAWNATCADGKLRDQFANAVGHRITQIDNCPGDAFVTAELVDDFVERCDKLFDHYNPASADEVKTLAMEVDTFDLYDLIQND